jgi:D-alanine-D-alanine ligase
MKKTRVVILFGGKSSEHSISCATAAGVLGAIDRNKYEIVPVGITKQGIFVPAQDNVERWALRVGELATVTDEGSRIDFSMDGSKEIFETQPNGSKKSLGVIDLVFPVLHGPFGEDGTIQGFLELAGFPYVGNGLLASAAGMDKEFTKALFQAAGIPVTEHVVIHQTDWLADPESALEKVRKLGDLPIFVKPARAGSSVGVSKVSNWNEFENALAIAFEQDSKLVVERQVVGRELECAVLEGLDAAAPRVSIAGEIVVHGREFYDFEAKYQDKDAVELIIPAKLSDAELSEMQKIASRAFRAIGGSGLARVDFFLTQKGFLVNEINTMPGFTPISMFPALWQESGISYPELIDELIALALAKH